MWKGSSVNCMAFVGLSLISNLFYSDLCCVGFDFVPLVSSLLKMNLSCMMFSGFEHRVEELCSLCKSYL